MPLTRYRRIANLWNWLPPFRAAAEYQSIQRAALALNMSASALSRTVRLLEDAIGAPLFVRASTGLMLTATGETLLAATRDAMRMIDDALHEPATAAQPRLVLAASGPFLPSLLGRAVSAHPTLLQAATLEIRTVASDEVAEHLLRGAIDLAFVHEAELNRELIAQAVGALQSSTWAPKNAAAAPCVMVATSDAPEAEDGVGETLWVDALDAAIELARCSALPLRCPDVLAPSDFSKQPAAASPPLPVLALLRKPLPGQQRDLLDQLLVTMRELLVSSR